MPKSQKLKSGMEASDPAAEAGSGSDADAIMTAIKQMEQRVLTKIDSSVMAAAGELHKKMDNLASDSRTQILSVYAEFTKVNEEVQKERMGMLRGQQLSNSTAFLESGCSSKGHGCRSHHPQQQAFLHLPRLLSRCQKRESSIHRGAEDYFAGAWV